ncbi:MAG: SH3 domain-containing protein [Chloroflexi bacterium]|nr:SH3 domain-containing protein [Chloroflexota bacterium]
MGIAFPIFLSIVGLMAVIYTYSTIKRGGSKSYTLERELILRRATAMLWLSTGLFGSAVGWLVWQDMSRTAELTAASETPAVVATTANAPEPSATPNIPPPSGGTLPDLVTASPAPTIDPNLPTPTPTRAIVRAFVTGTGGNGVNFRTTPGGELIEVLADDTFVTVLDEEAPQEQGGFTWIKIRTFTGEEGWVVTDFMSIDQ